MATDSSERGSQAIHRTLRILDCFTLASPTVSLTELTRQTGLTTSTAHRIVKALQRTDFLTQDPLTNRYALGPAVMRLARVIMARVGDPELVAAAMPHLERLRTLTDETVGLHLIAPDGRYCVAEFVSHQPLRLSTGVGHNYPLYQGAAGKAILAWTTDAVLATVLDQLPAHDDAPTPRALKTDLARVRANGYALSIGDVVPGANAIAAPVLTDTGEAVAAINVTGPANRWSRKAMESYADELTRAAAELSRQVGIGRDA